MAEDQGVVNRAGQAAAFVEASNLMRTAHRAFRGLDRSAGDRSQGQGDALVAVIFAATALEAFINELPELVMLVYELFGSPSDIMSSQRERWGLAPAVVNCAQALATAEESNAPIQLKYMMASICLRGTAFDRGRAPYQEFSDLIDLRHSLVHLKGQRYSQGLTHVPDRQLRQSILRRLRAKNILADLPADHQTSISTWISTPAVARWALNTASAMVREVLEMIPDGQFRRDLDGHYWEPFGPVK
jgi:hypothetical protein